MFDIIDRLLAAIILVSPLTYAALGVYAYVVWMSWAAPGVFWLLLQWVRKNVREIL